MKYEGYDQVIEDYFGVYYGNETMVFVKTGRGGTIHGYKNKYLYLARRIREKYGYTVVVSANPLEYECDLGEEIDYIQKNIKEIATIYYVGISNGALIGAQQGHFFSRIKRMILVNGPLMINFHKTKRGLEAFKGDNVYMLYGEKDPSYAYFPILQTIRSKMLTYGWCRDADHNFAGKEEYLNLEIMKWIS